VSEAAADPAAPTAEGLLAEIHFETASARLTPGARQRAEAAAAALAGLAPEAIRVTGHADRTGPNAVNERLSRARAEAVAEVLIAAGIPAERISVAAFGAEPDHLPVPTDRGVSEPLNRCVAIWVEAAARAD
jgi:outer membrane protein OmpA-like peptidoglycan-associated protein